MTCSTLRTETSDQVILQLRVSAGGEWSRDAKLREHLQTGWTIADAPEVFPQDGYVYLTVLLKRKE